MKTNGFWDEVYEETQQIYNESFVMGIMDLSDFMQIPQHQLTCSLITELKKLREEVGKLKSGR